VCIFLKHENQLVKKALAKYKVMQHLQSSKKIRQRYRLKTLLLSKRGLGAAFTAGLLRELMQDDDKSTKRASASKIIKATRLGLNAWI
jgi:hypothetical protein